MRAADGAVVVVDLAQDPKYNSSRISVDVYNAIQTAGAEYVKPVIFFDNIDLMLMERQLEKEELYMLISQYIDGINAYLNWYHVEDIIYSPDYDFKVHPSINGNVLFGSIKRNFGFTLRDIANKYRASMNRGIENEIRTEKIMSRFLKNLWGDNFCGEDSERCFNRYALDPLYKLLRLHHHATRPELLQFAKEKLGVYLSATEQDLRLDELVFVILSKYMPLAPSLLRMVTDHLPSPITAQPDKAPIVYSGPADDEIMLGIVNADNTSQLVISVVRTFVSTDSRGGQEAVSFGRVFSGVAEGGLKVSFFDPGEFPGDGETGSVSGNMKQVFAIVGRKLVPVDACPAGNVCAFTFGAEVRQYLPQGRGTITTFNIGTAGDFNDFI